MNLVKNALILAAGRGRRLMPFTKDRPKCLVKVGGKPILYYQLSALGACGIKDITIVIGYRAAMVRNYAKKYFSGLNFKLIYNDKYLTTNDIYSFALAKDFAGKDFIQIDSDVLFNPDIIRSLILNSNRHSITAIRKTKCGEEEMKVVVDENGNVCRIGKSLDFADCYGEFMSISLFTKDFSRRLYPAMAKMITETGPHVYSGEAMDEVVREGVVLKSFVIPKDRSIEIDFPKDIVLAERKVLKYVKI